jgi:type II secretory pathway pseudopilin PulG
MNRYRQILELFGRSRKRCQRGFAIFTVVFVVVIFAILGIAAVALITGSTRMMSDEYHTQQALDVAQAGLAYTAEQLADDDNWSDNTGFTMSFGPGSFTITFLAQAENSATVRSDGTVEGITRSVKQEFGEGDLPKAFTKAIYTEGEIDVDGSATGDIDGDVSAGGGVDEGEGVDFDGDVDEGNPDAEVPTPDWSYWQSIADSVIGSNYNFGSGTYTGIYYITGNVSISSDVTINGTIIARGNVGISGGSNITISATAPNPAIIAEGSVLFSGATGLTINGWVFSMDTVTFTGNTDIEVTGGFTAQGDVTFTGNTDADVDFDESYAPTDGFDGGEMTVGSSNWEEVY